MTKNDTIVETTLNEYNRDGIKVDNPLMLEFYRALKNQKIFGIFAKKYGFHELTAMEKLRALRSTNYVDIGNLTVVTDNSDFMKRIKIINAAIYSHTNYNSGKWPTLKWSQYLEAYAIEYFKNKKIHLNHSRLYYQFLFGLINVFIGLILILSTIYYFWGKIIFTFIFAISIYVIYKLMITKNKIK